jgi:hypothetical protein
MRYRLSAYCCRLRPGTTAELASLVLQMSDEIDTRERMLDAALRPAPDAAGPDLASPDLTGPDLASRRPEAGRFGEARRPTRTRHPAA